MLKYVRITVMTATKKMAVIGQGYVGLPLSISAVQAGWQVYGIDTNSDKVLKLNESKSHIEDVLDSDLNNALLSKKYRASSDFSLVAKVSVVVICVPTPLNKRKLPDLSLLKLACRRIAPHLLENTLIVTESTSYPGTLRNLIIPIINKYKKTNVNNLKFAVSPERINPGDLSWNQKNTPRLVGAVDKYSLEQALDFYNSFCQKVVSVDSPEIAEAAKLLENSFRLVNIALVNEFSKILEISKININDVINAASTKPYGYMPFRSGVGVGGHCIPVDPIYFTWWAESLGMNAQIIKTASKINEKMPEFVAKKAIQIIGRGVKKPRVLLIGVAYKPNINDTRNTPTLAIRDYLIQNKVKVAWHDPVVKNWLNSESVDISWKCDLAILVTKHSNMNLNYLIERGTKILDCTNTLQSNQNIINL